MDRACKHGYTNACAPCATEADERAAKVREWYLSPNRQIAPIPADIYNERVAPAAPSPLAHQEAVRRNGLLLQRPHPSPTRKQ